MWPWFVPAQTWARGKISWYFMIGKDLVFALVLMGVNYAMATSQDVAEGYRSLGGLSVRDDHCDHLDASGAGLGADGLVGPGRCGGRPRFAPFPGFAPPPCALNSLERQLRTGTTEWNMGLLLTLLRPLSCLLRRYHILRKGT